MSAVGFALLAFGGLLVWAGLGGHSLGSVIGGVVSGTDPTYGGAKWGGGSSAAPVAPTAKSVSTSPTPPMPATQGVMYA